MRDAGAKGNARVLELELPGEKSSPKTKYLIDDTSSRVTGIEFETGEVEAHVFSDFRMVQGVSTPFRIERYVDGRKIEETQFTSVRYNASVKDEVFKP